MNRPLSILVVDDDDIFRQAIEDELRAAFRGVMVNPATDGADGVERCHFQSFDLIVTDMKMPRLTGLEMLACVRRSGVHTPAVIVSSAELPPGDRSEAGEFLYLPKHELKLLPDMAERLLGSQKSRTRRALATAARAPLPPVLDQASRR